MSSDVEQLALYLHLARASQMRQRLLVRDRLLVVAGAMAADAGLGRIAAFCRHKILEHNPAHMMRRWDDFPAALEDEEFRQFHRQVARRFPREKAEQMLQSLGIQLANEREAYYSDEEYAASIWGVTGEHLDDMFPEADETA